MAQFHNGLVEAYKGKYEEEMREDFNEHFAEHGLGAAKDEHEFNYEWIIKKIQSDSNLKRMEVYCEWNGIIGYASTLYHMAHDGGYISG